MEETAAMVAKAETAEMEEMVQEAAPLTYPPYLGRRT
jgi:hypothetical protein